MKMFWGGIEYEADDHAALVEYLTLRPDERADYRESVWRLAVGCMTWGDYTTAAETLALMCQVLAATGAALGEPVFSPRGE